MCLAKTSFFCQGVRRSARRSAGVSAPNKKVRTLSGAKNKLRIKTRMTFNGHATNPCSTQHFLKSSPSLARARRIRGKRQTHQSRSPIRGIARPRHSNPHAKNVGVSRPEARGDVVGTIIFGEGFLEIAWIQRVLPFNLDPNSWTCGARYNKFIHNQ